MPIRRPEKLTGLRIELQQRDRELVEQAILVNGISGVARGVGNAIGGLGLAVGLVGAVLVWKEGGDFLRKILEKDRADWEKKNLTQAKYDAYLQLRTDEWIKAAKKAGRYAPAIGDAENTAWWSALDASRGPVHQALTFTDWEAKAYPNDPPMLYDAWCNEKKAEITVKRRALVGTIFPPLNLIGISQYGFMDWFSGRK